MMDQKTLDSLKKEDENNPLHDAILDEAKRLVKMSRSKMSQNHGDWDIHDRVYRGEAIPDEEDRVNEQKGKPSKMIVPNTFAQCMTFTSFLFLLFRQNRRFFELNPNSSSDYGSVDDDCETVLEHNVLHNVFNQKLFQHILDTSRFGLSPIDTSWTVEKTWAKVPAASAAMSFMGITTAMPQSTSSYQQFTKYEGNLFRNISPYRFFPDTAYPLCDMQSGRFVAYDEDYSMQELRRLEVQDEVAGIDHIGAMPRNIKEDLGAPIVGVMKGWDGDAFSRFDTNNSTSMALVTKVQMKLVPAQFKYGEGKKETLGSEDFPIIYHVWIANNNRIIRFEPCGNWHGEFSVSCAQFTPDMHRTVTDGLAGLIYALQSIITWYINSHVRSVTRVIGNRLIINPAVIDTKTLDGEGDIYVRKGVSPPSLDRVVGQLRAQDVTQGHMQDAEILSRLIETVTGVNGNAMGQYNSGRRSAQEARVVTAGAAGRMKMHAQLIWEASLGRSGRLALSNLRQELSFDSFSRIIGPLPDDAMPEVDPMTGMPSGPMPKSGVQKLQERYAAFQGKPEDIIGSDDFNVFDSTLSSEKGFMAQGVQELFGILTNAPGLAQANDISLKAMLEEMSLLRGLGSVDRYSLSKRVAAGKEPRPKPTPEEQMMQAQMLQMQQGQGEGQNGAGGPGITHNPNHSTATTIAPVVHIHNPKPNRNGNKPKATPARK